MESVKTLTILDDVEQEHSNEYLDPYQRDSPDIFLEEDVHIS